MKRAKYDIFISYRRDGGAQYARTLQLMLEKKGYKVFLDYDELVDGKFSPKIEAAIKEAPVYLVILTKGSMARCANEGDWVRKEIEIALRERKHIIPVNPDNTFDGIPENVPSSIKEAIEGTQYSEINFGQALNATVDLMVNNRIKPYIRRKRFHVWLYVLMAVIVLGVGGFFSWKWKANQDMEALKKSITFNGQPINWADEVTQEQLIAIQEILSRMKPIEGGEFMQGAIPLSDGSYHKNVQVELEAPARKVNVKPFYISAFEVTVGQWNAIMNDDREGDPDLPVGNVTYSQVLKFLKILNNLTTCEFRLPTESEWEYAAKGSNRPEGFMFAGSDNPDDVAFYAKNSNGLPHSDPPGTPTNNDLFNMSGNVSEWCSTKFVPYDPSQPLFGEGAMTTRGGNYDSEEYEITVTHREPAMPDTSIPTLGFRIAHSR